MVVTITNYDEIINYTLATNGVDMSNLVEITSPAKRSIGASLDSAVANDVTTIDRRLPEESVFVGRTNSIWQIERN